MTRPRLGVLLYKGRYSQVVRDIGIGADASPCSLYVWGSACAYLFGGSCMIYLLSGCQKSGQVGAGMASTE